MLTIPQCVDDILGWWLEKVQSILTGNLKNVTLFGSVALDDYQTAWSDIDVCVVVNTAINEITGTEIGRIHDNMRDTFISSATWQSNQVVEGFYISLEMAADPALDRACYVAGGTTRKWYVGHPVSPFDRYLLSHHGITYWGDPVSFAPPSLSALRMQLKEDVESLGKFEEYPALWLAGILHWIPRALVFWRDGIMLSKTAALEHEITSGSPYAPVFVLALELRKRGSAAVENAYQELLEKYRPLVTDIQRELTHYGAIST
jgi:predicted nucleotidyltransferase